MGSSGFRPEENNMKSLRVATAQRDAASAARAARWKGRERPEWNEIGCSYYKSAKVSIDKISRKKKSYLVEKRRK